MPNVLAPPALRTTPAPATTPTRGTTTEALLAGIAARPDVPCFIVAPRRMGRSALLFRYLYNAHEPSEVLVLDGSRPGFAASLEDDALVDHLAGLGAAGENGFGVLAIDDLCRLEEGAATRLSDCIDGLIDKGWRVLVVTTPLNDCMADLQSDRLLIDGQDLFAVRGQGMARGAEVIEAFFEEGAPSEIRVLAALMLLLQHGSIYEIAALGFTVAEDTPLMLNYLCPLFEYDEASGLFAVPAVEPGELGEQVVRAFVDDYELHVNGATGGLGRAAGFISSKQVFFEHAAKVTTYLRERGDEVRAGQVEGFVHALRAGGDEVQGETTVMPLSAPEEPFAVVVGGMVEEAALHIHLFGQLEVWHDGIYETSPLLKRGKVGSLLTYLALSGMRGMSRDAILDNLWPGMEPERATSNYYVAWSMLRRALPVAHEGERPYLERRGSVCFLDVSRVSTDVEEFRMLAARVICRQGVSEGVLEALRRISDDFEDCKLAVIGNDPWIAGHQQRLTALLVDSLLAGVHIYRELRQFDNALWFARRVYEVDPTREDVCQAYMQAQFECGQRASAIRTYLACRRYLTDELGILPSARTNEIYQGIILDRH